MKKLAPAGQPRTSTLAQLNDLAITRGIDMTAVRQMVGANEEPPEHDQLPAERDRSGESASGIRSSTGSGNSP